MMSDPGIAAVIGGRFDQVLVDEYQDTNKLQASILLGMKSDRRGLTVVGDDAQSICSGKHRQVRNGYSNFESVGDLLFEPVRCSLLGRWRVAR